MAAEIILSLCIPTYNRASYLDICLNSIVKDVGNNAQIEIVISDNVSNDNTPDIVRKYIEQYSNIRYIRNEVNIGGDANFIQVLTSGKGQFLKLLNDYVEFKEGAVTKILEIVKRHLHNKEVIFFANGLSHLKNKEFHYSRNFKEFLYIVSDRCTWIGAFGVWKDDLDLVMRSYKFKTSNFFHTEILFESVYMKKNAVTYSPYIYSSTEISNKKAPYNFFDLFVNTYFNTLIGGLKNENKITASTYRQEKNRFFSNFIFMWYKKIKIKKDQSTEFNAEGAERIIFESYKYNPILYLYLLYLPFYLIGFYFKKLLRSKK